MTTQERTQKRTETHSCDLISRQAAVELIKNYCENGCDLAEENWCPSCQREQFIKLLKELPPAEPEPDLTEIMVVCDNCGHIIHVKRVNVLPLGRAEGR